jgi:hypothetical protein
MISKRMFSAAVAFLLFSFASLASAQLKMTASNDSLCVSASPYHADVSYKLSDLQSMPRTTATIHNPHSNTDESYSGVRLADILGPLKVPVGDGLRGEALAICIIATGSDGYKVALSIAEIDPAFHPGEVIVADALNGKPLSPDIGPFRLVVTEDKRPARAVRNLVSIELKSLK